MRTYGRAMATFAGSSPPPRPSPRFRERIEATGLSLVATTRSDGWPRVSAWEAFLCDGGLYMGSMPNAMKAKDLRRDARCCIITPLADKDDLSGEAFSLEHARSTTPVSGERVRKAFLDLRDFDMGDLAPTSSPTTSTAPPSSASKATIGARAAGPPPGPRARAARRPRRVVGSLTSVERFVASRRFRSTDVGRFSGLAGRWSLNLSTPARKPSAKIV